MIQRVQSIWLFLVSLTLFLLLILPIVTNHTSSGDIWLQVGGLYQKINNVTQKTENYSALFGGTILIGLISLANIFTFKNRTLQKRIIILNIIFIVALIAGILYCALRISNDLSGLSFNAGAYLPILSLIFCVLAFRGIRKDELLIKSADRLR